MLKYSPYSPYSRCSLFKIREHGIQSREIRKYFRNRPICSSQGQNYDSVRLIDCYAALLILAYGCALSLMLLLAEKLHVKLMQKKLRERDIE